MSIYHKHHIIPRHMGGTNDPENLVTVTIEQHANLHKQLWEDLGHTEDYIAWKALAGLIDRQEMNRLLQSLGGKKGGPIAGQKCKDKKIGYCGMTKEENIAAGKKSVKMKVGIHSDNWDKAIGGRKGGRKCKEQKIGFLADGFDKSKGGKASYAAKVGIHSLTKEERHFYASKAGQKCKEQKIGFLADGFDLGKASRGKIWINKDNVEMKIFPNDYENLKSEGWNKGRKTTFRKGI